MYLAKIVVDNKDSWSWSWSELHVAFILGCDVNSDVPIMCETNWGIWWSFKVVMIIDIKIDKSPSDGILHYIKKSILTNGI